MDDALLVRGLQRLGNLLRDGQRLVDRNRPRAMRSASVGPSTSSITSACTPSDLLKAVDVGDVRMIERGEDLGFALEPSESVGVRREGVRQHLQGIVPLEPRVMRSPDLAHPALANQGGDFIGAEAAAGANGHVRQILRCSYQKPRGVLRDPGVTTQVDIP